MKIKKTTLRSIIRESIREMLSEAASKSIAFSPKKMAALGKKDPFIAAQLKRKKPEVVFNTYVLGDSAMERLYASVNEMTTTGDVAGYDAPLGYTRKKDED